MLTSVPADVGGRGFGSQLASQDINNIRELVRFIARNALLPHVEKQIYILNDLVR